MSTEDGASESKRMKRRAVNKKGWNPHATPPRDKQLKEEEGQEEDSPTLPSFRKTSVQALQELFVKAKANINGESGVQQPADYLRRFAEEVEEAIFEQYGSISNPYESTRAYGNQIRTLRYNILQNKDLQGRIITGGLNAMTIARLTPEEMLTTTARLEQHEKEAKAYDMQRLDRHLAPQVEEELAARMAGGGLTCPVCDSDKVGMMHRHNALEEEQQRQVEMACNACGATMAQEE